MPSSPLPPDDGSVNKLLIGISAGICLAVAAGMWIWAPEQIAVIGAFVRCGVVLAALTFALPKPGAMQRWRSWMPTIVVGLVSLAVLRQRILVLLPILITLGVLSVLLRPREPVRPQRR